VLVLLAFVEAGAVLVCVVVALVGAIVVVVGLLDVVCVVVRAVVVVVAVVLVMLEVGAAPEVGCGTQRHVSQPSSSKYSATAPGLHLHSRRVGHGDVVEVVVVGATVVVGVVDGVVLGLLEVLCVVETVVVVVVVGATVVVLVVLVVLVAGAAAEVVCGTQRHVSQPFSSKYSAMAPGLHRHSRRAGHGDTGDTVDLSTVVAVGRCEGGGVRGVVVAAVVAASPDVRGRQRHVSQPSSTKVTAIAVGLQRHVGGGGHRCDCTLSTAYSSASSSANTGDKSGNEGQTGEFMVSHVGGGGERHEPFELRRHSLRRTALTADIVKGHDE
jgi:hypothetical protein